jgi:hypothetical protein
MAPGCRSIDMMDDNSGLLGGIVNADENYVGGKGGDGRVAARRLADWIFASLRACKSLALFARGSLRDIHRAPRHRPDNRRDGMVAAWPLPSSNCA